MHDWWREGLKSQMRLERKSMNILEQVSKSRQNTRRQRKKSEKLAASDIEDRRRRGNTFFDESFVPEPEQTGTVTLKPLHGDRGSRYNLWNCLSRKKTDPDDHGSV